MNIHPLLGHPAFKAAVRRIAEACGAHGKLARGSAETEAQIEEYSRLGCEVLKLPSTDVRTYLDGLRARPGRDIWRLGCYISAMQHIDWTECALIERVPGRVGGQPVLRGTRLRPQDLLINRDEGIDWLSRNHGVAPETIRALFAFYDAHKAALVPHPS